MKILWVCSKSPKVVAEAAGIDRVHSGGWLDSTAADLLASSNVLRVLFLGDHLVEGSSGNLSFASFEGDVSAAWFCRHFDCFQPDVIHVWGTEFPHSLEALQAAHSCGIEGSAVVSIQGLVSVIGRYHYSEGMTESAMHVPSFGDFVRRTSLDNERRDFIKRGGFERECLRLAKHVIGRTEWDKACVLQINPCATYHHCNESLRAEFYNGSWDLNNVERYSLFVSQCSYPVKGFHYALQALFMLKKDYPNVLLYTTGESVFRDSLRKNLGRPSYQAYIAHLISKLDLRDNVRFLGSLDAMEMRKRYLRSHVFVSASTIENSPNSVGEAMLLGCPVVSSNVGGVSDMLAHREEGFLYQSSAPYMLAWYVSRIFNDDVLAKRFSDAARKRAAQTHDRGENLNKLMSIYRAIGAN